MSAGVNGVRQWVVKVGSSVIAHHQGGLTSPSLVTLANQIGALRKEGIHVLLVSSGAVALGMERTGEKKRPHSLDSLQALAALGQADLVTLWRSELARHSLDAALVLLTRWDTEDRKRYLNIRNTLEKLRQLGVVPVINENDSVATDELQFGDNDILAGLVVNLVGAEKLVLMTDRDGLYDKDPALHEDASLVESADVLDERLNRMATPSVNSLGRGGMSSKLKAARLGARSGADCWIVNGLKDGILVDLAAGKGRGTRFTYGRNAAHGNKQARRNWLAGRSTVKGVVHLDAGAATALLERGASLLPVGVVRVEGEFKGGDLISCRQPDGREVAIGLANYDSNVARRLIGKKSSEVAGLFSHPVTEELIHRNNMLLSLQAEGSTG